MNSIIPPLQPIVTPLMMKPMMNLLLSRSQPSTLAIIKLKCVRTIQKWDIALIGKNANLLMALKNFIGRSPPKKPSIERKNANRFGKNLIVTMDRDANFLTMNIQIQKKKVNNF